MFEGEDIKTSSFKFGILGRLVRSISRSRFCFIPISQFFSTKSMRAIGGSKPAMSAAAAIVLFSKMTNCQALLTSKLSR